MVSWLVTDFGGMVPRKTNRLLPDVSAEVALNCELDRGLVQGMQIPELVKDLTNASKTIRKAYRIPAGTAANAPGEVWLPLPSEYSQVVPSPLANDYFGRVYFTNPSDGGYFTTALDAFQGNAAYNLGVTQPGLGISQTPIVKVTGGTTDGSVPLESRSYCYTFVDTFGLESAPSEPSLVVDGPSDGVWNISEFPSTQPASPAGSNFPRVMLLRLYRTVTGTTTGAAFYLVRELHYNAALDAVNGGTSILGEQMPANANTAGITDTTPDSYVVEQTPLITAAYGNAPAGLDNLTLLPGGMLVGSTGNTLHFCEPFLPHTWPAAYDISVEHPIVGLAVWQQTLFIATEGFPYTGSGTSPGNFTLSVVRAAEPCIARGSIVADLMGVSYASPNGLIQLSYFGAQNTTDLLVTRQQWVNGFIGNGIIAVKHRSQYLALNPTAGSGFLIDHSEPRIGMVNISNFVTAVALWNDNYTGATYVIANQKVYEWDPLDAADGRMIWRWRSKLFSLAAAASLGAVQVLLDPTAATAGALARPALPFTGSNDPSSLLPAGDAAVLNIYADEVLRATIPLNAERTMARLPSGFLAFDWQFEVIGCVPMRRVELASSMRELRRV